MCLAEGRPFDLFGDGLQSRSFTYVGDVVRGTIAAMDGGSGTYNVGGGEEATMRETIAIFEELAGRPLEIRDHPAVPGRPAAHEGRHVADSERARLGADDDACGTVSRPSGSGPLLGSRRDERDANRPIPTPSGRSTSAPRGRGSRRAGGCPSPGS